jgi:DNA-binding CsgD family transcriptional regulator/DNA invertase Pin-like site-specific DNA recombinase
VVLFIFILDIAFEPGVSGTWTIRQLPVRGVPVREVLSDLIDRCMTERPHALMVDTQDRLTREAALWFAIYSMFLRPYGVKLWIVDGDLDLDNPDDEMIAGFRALLSQAEVRKMSQRALRWRREQRDAGYAPGGQIGFGWRSETGGIVPVPEEAEWVKWIVKQYTQRGRTILDICAELNDRQVPYRGSEVTWYPGRVRHILNHPFHAGLVWDNEHKLVEGAHYEQRYCDPDVYYRIQDIKSQRATRGPRALSQRDAPLLGVIRCGMCGHRLQLARDRRGQAFYVCPKPQEGENRRCIGLSKRADAVECLVAQAIGEIVAAPKLREMVRQEASLALGERRERLECSQKALKKRLEQLDRRLNEWAAKLTDGTVSDKAFVRISQQWEADREEAEQELAEVERKLEQGDVEDRRVDQVMAALDSFEETWERMDAERIRNLLMQMVKRLTLEPDGNSGATLRLECHYMPEIGFHIPHLHESLGQHNGCLSKLTLTDLAFLALWEEGKSMREIEESRGTAPGYAYSQAARSRKKTGMKDLDAIAVLSAPLVERYRPLLPVDRRSAKPTSQPNPEPTERELQVARLLAQDLTCREIAKELGIKEGSVVGFFTPLRKKLGVKTIREALMVLAAQGKLEFAEDPGPGTERGGST